MFDLCDPCDLHALTSFVYLDSIIVTVVSMFVLMAVQPDYDECWLGSARCDHKCDNTLTGFQCSCNLGFNLQSDGRTCRLKQPESVGQLPQVNSAFYSSTDR